jgi:NodT family efflux transporter outer membrane factor (OMF) lipoprotein
MFARGFHRAARGAVLAAPLILAACAVGPNYQRPALSPSASYQAPSPEQPAPRSVGAQPNLVVGMDVPAEWWRAFGSDALDVLVAQALNNNPNLAAAKASLRAAREAVLAQRGAYYPSIEASITPSRQQFTSTLSSPTASGADLYTLTTSQVSVAYTPDLFGANRRAVESLVAQEDAQRFEFEAARMTIAANVVLAAIQDASLRAQIDATQLIIADQQKTLASFQRQFQLGQVSRADLAAQQAVLAQAQAALPPLDEQFQVNRDLVAALLGKTPGDAPDARFDLQSITLPNDLPLSVPARLVEQRPDVRIAEAQLHAASAQVGVAVAARLPNLQIAAAAGSAPLDLGISLSSAATFWSLAGTLTQPLFEGGALLHRQRGAEAAYNQAAGLYQATVVGAFQNTADVLTALRTDADAERAAEEAEKAAAKSLDIAKRQLNLGDISPLALLAAEQSYTQSRLALLQTQANRYADVVALFQALGGGWWNRSDTAAARKP